MYVYINGAICRKKTEGGCFETFLFIKINHENMNFITAFARILKNIFFLLHNEVA